MSFLTREHETENNTTYELKANTAWERLMLGRDILNNTAQGPRQ